MFSKHDRCLHWALVELHLDRRLTGEQWDVFYTFFKVTGHFLGA